MQVMIEFTILLSVILQKGWTALMLASYRGHTEVVELLLKQMDNCDVNLTTEVELI